MIFLYNFGMPSRHSIWLNDLKHKIMLQDTQVSNINFIEVTDSYFITLILTVVKLCNTEVYFLQVPFMMSGLGRSQSLREQQQLQQSVMLSNAGSTMQSSITLSYGNIVLQGLGMDGSSDNHCPGGGSGSGELGHHTGLDGKSSEVSNGSSSAVATSSLLHMVGLLPR